MKRERQWTGEQLEVIRARGKDLLVSAAAGSGKTAVLVERILQRITDPAHPADIDRNKGMSVLSYLGLLLLIPFLARKDSPYARFHVNQGMVLFLTEAAYNILYRIIRSVFGHGILSPIVSILGILDIVFLILMIMGIVNAASGKAKELPIIGKIRILQ